MSAEVAHLELRVTSDGYVTAENRFGAAAKSAEVFERALNKLESQQKRADKSAKRIADAAARQLARENDQWNDALQRALARDEKRVESARKAAEKIAEAHRKEQEEKGFRGAILGMGEGIQKAIPGLGMLAGAGGVAIIGAKIAEGMVEAAHATIETAVEMENLKARLSGVTGSTEEANKKFSDLEEMTVGKLPFKVAQVTDAFIQLQNAGLDGSEDAMKSYANMAAQTGASIGDVASAVQAASIGNYRSLRAYGIKVTEEGSNLNVTFRGHTETVRKSSEAIQGYLQKLGEVEFAGAAERQMETIGGSIIKAKQSWEKLVETVANGPVGEFIATGMKEAASSIKLASDAFEGFMSLFPQAQRMSEEASKNLAHFMDPKWGKESKDTTQKDWDDLFADLADKAKSSSDKRLEAYMTASQRIDDLAKKALEQGKVFDATTAHANLYAAYNHEEGGDKKSIKTANKPKEQEYILRSRDQDAEDKYLKKLAQQHDREVERVKSELTDKEESEKESYERRKADLENFANEEIALGRHVSQMQRDSWAQQMQDNETMWTLHLAKLADMKEKAAAKDASKEDEFQKRIRSFGEKPQSTFQQINTKFAGQQIDLKNAFGDRLKDDPSNPFSDDAKLKAQQQYREKSVAIERERIREINEANAQLIQNSAQNAEAMFGNLATASMNFAGQQSGIYKAMFATQKAFAVASAEVSMAVGIGKAMELGWPAGIPAAIGAAAEGAKILAIISSSNYAGAYDRGGDIPAGRFGIVGEYGPEFVRGPATVTSRQQTAQAMSGGGGMGGGWGQPQAPQTNNVAIHFDVHEQNERWLSSTRGQTTMNLYFAKNARTIQALAGGKP